MENGQDNLLKECNTLANETENFALSIWHFIKSKYYELFPVHLSVYHHFDGMVHIECNEYIFTTIRYCSVDDRLLQFVSDYAEQCNIKGKLFLHSSNDFLKVLDFSFCYNS